MAESSESGGVTRRDVFRTAALLGGAMVASRAGYAIGLNYEARKFSYTGEYPLDNPDFVTLSTCLGCHSSCPTRVAQEEHVLAKIDGNPFCTRTFTGAVPQTVEEAAGKRGVVCARGQARLQNTHDPHRLVKPLVRVGQRGSGQWVTIAPEKLRETLLHGHEGPGVQAVLEDWGEGKFHLAIDPRQQDRAPVARAFAKAFGTGQVHLGHSAPWLLEAADTYLDTPGWLIEPRWERATAALIWGADPLASGIDMVADSRGYGTLEGRKVVVDPRLSEAAGMADLWLPVRPGGDMALAWMLLRAFKELGAIDPPEDWWRLVGGHPMTDLELRAGLGQEIVRRAARMLAVGSGLAVRIGGGVGEQPRGAAVAAAILGLSAAQGGLGPGGAMEAVRRPDPLGVRPLDALSDLFARNERIDVLVVVDDGGLVDSAAQTELLEIMSNPRRVGLLVCVTTSMNPVAAIADVIIPDVTEHERRGMVVRHDGISLVQPVLPSQLHETGLEAPWDRGLEGLLTVLADVAGNALDVDEVLDEALFDTSHPTELRERGWIAPPPTDEEAPVGDPWATFPSLPQWARHKEVHLVTYRESFGGFTDSTAQYWSTPSLRRTNEAWIHPDTAEELGIHVSHGHGTPEPWVMHLQGAGNALTVRAKPMMGVRPGVVALAIGYGHYQGFDGLLEIDGYLLSADRRRALGVDTGSIRTPYGVVTITGAEPAPAPSFWSLFANPDGTCARI